MIAADVAVGPSTLAGLFLAAILDFYSRRVQWGPSGVRQGRIAGVLAAARRDVSSEKTGWTFTTRARLSTASAVTRGRGTRYWVPGKVSTAVGAPGSAILCTDYLTKVNVFTGIHRRAALASCRNPLRATQLGHPTGREVGAMTIHNIKRRPRRFALYWCTTPDGDEDWFVVAPTARAARAFHDLAEGYEAGTAKAERVVALPPELQDGATWRDPETGDRSPRAGWPSDAVLRACGGEFAELGTDGIRSALGVVCKLVRVGARVFRPGDSIWNRERLMGLSLPPRLGVFRGGG